MWFSAQKGLDIPKVTLGMLVTFSICYLPSCQFFSHNQKISTVSGATKISFRRINALDRALGITGHRFLTAPKKICRQIGSRENNRLQRGGILECLTVAILFGRFRMSD